MKVLSAEQLRQADRVTVENRAISSNELMERAGTMIFREIHRLLENRRVPIVIFSGVGNNGGDGLVVGRLLLEEGYDVTVYIVNYSDQRSKDFLVNYDRIKGVSNDWPLLLRGEEDLPEISQETLVIDGIFGTGLNRPIPTWVGELISRINDSGAYILSIDIPSGMFTSQVTPEPTYIIRADRTLTIEAPKLVFYLPQTQEYTGHVSIIGIGLDPEFIANLDPEATLVTSAVAREIYRPRKKNSHKGTYGHSLLIGGSFGKIGSIALATRAALRAGSGLVTAFVPGCGYEILQTLVPEAMVLTDPQEAYLSDINYDLNPDAIGFGVGVGTGKETATAFLGLLERSEAPLVIDADGLNILAAHREYLSKIPPQSILTPHPGELRRLLGTNGNDFEALDAAKEFVGKYELNLILKGSHTITITPTGMYINTTGNPGMATAGSGDVLTGILSALLAQKYPPLETALFGVFIHGLAGDIAAGELGQESVMAGDIADRVGRAILYLVKPPEPQPQKDKPTDQPSK